jgi:hypothetical protein
MHTKEETQASNIRRKQQATKTRSWFILLAFAACKPSSKKAFVMASIASHSNY